MLQAIGYFAVLAEGGEVTLPLMPMPWDAEFGQLTEKFGIGWMASISAAK